MPVIAGRPGWVASPPREGRGSSAAEAATAMRQRILRVAGAGSKAVARPSLPIRGGAGFSEPVPVPYDVDHVGQNDRVDQED